MDNLRCGSILRKDSELFCYKQTRLDGRTELFSVQTGELLKIPPEEIHLFKPDNIQQKKTELALLSDEQWQIALHRYQVISWLIEKQRSGLSKSESFDKTAKKFKISTITIYRWLRQYEKSGNVADLVRRGRSDKGSGRIGGELEKLIEDAIENDYLTIQLLTPTQTYRNLCVRCFEQGLEPPHFNTFLNRIKKIPPSILAARRDGKQAARKFNPIRGHFPGADYPYSVIQIDHTQVDIMLVDDQYRLSLQRPNITVAIDIFSRMIAGYYISFDPPGTIGTALCIANAVMPKDSYLESHDIPFAWPCQGLPKTIHLDNAKEFRSEALQRACARHGIDLQYRPVRTPHFGGSIERLMGTLMSEIHALPGTTRSNNQELGEYVPAKHASMTLSEFEKWFNNLVLGVYHNRIHRDLKCSPIFQYQLGIEGDDLHPGKGIPPQPRNYPEFLIDFLPFEERTIQPYGIAWDGIYYQADVLSRWIGAKDPKEPKKKRKFIVRRDPRDISSVLFFDPELEQYFRIPYQNMRFPVVSLWELRAIQTYLAERGKRNCNQDEIFTALSEMQRIQNSSVAKTQLAKKERIRQAKSQTRKAALVKEKKIHSPPPMQEISVPELDDITPFDDVEEI